MMTNSDGQLINTSFRSLTENEFQLKLKVELMVVTKF